MHHHKPPPTRRIKPAGMWHVLARTIPNLMSPTAPSLQAFNRIVNRTPEEHLYSGDRVRVLNSPYSRMLGREYAVVEHDDHGTLKCKAYDGAMEFTLYTYQVKLVYRPIVNKLKALFQAFAA